MLGDDMLSLCLAEEWYEFFPVDDAVAGRSQTAFRRARRQGQGRTRLCLDRRRSEASGAEPARHQRRRLGELDLGCGHQFLERSRHERRSIAKIKEN
jgi:hypothetical protein